MQNTFTAAQSEAIMELFEELRPKAPATTRTAEAAMEDAITDYAMACELDAFAWGFTLGQRFAKLPEAEAQVLMQVVERRAAE